LTTPDNTSTVTPEEGLMSRVEILTIGDELVEGRLLDSNTTLIADRLTSEGFRVTRQVSVGDDRQAIAFALREAAGRADAVLVSGGLGPTSDDLTAEAAAEAFGAPLARFPAALEHTRCFFAARDRPMPPSNEKQADLPAGSELLPNPWGTAMGFRLRVATCWVAFMPGVPRELEGILEASVLPHLRSVLSPEPRALATLKLFGLGESEVGERLAGLEVDLPAAARLWIQYRATFPEIHVRLVLAGLPEAASAECLRELTEEARRRLGRHVFAVGGARVDVTFAETVLATLAARGVTFAAAEGCTAGALSRLALEVPGGGGVFRGGVVTPDPAARAELLGPTAAVPALLGAALAETMAVAIRARLGATLGVATVGSSAGEGGLRAGELHVAVAGPDRTSARELFYPIDPERFRVLAAHAALARLRSWVERPDA
jgi:nicotinamide-nucleotide amidase